jgi:hypothetical protein
MHACVCMYLYAYISLPTLILFALCRIAYFINTFIFNLSQFLFLFIAVFLNLIWPSNSKDFYGTHNKILICEAKRLDHK